VEQSVTASDDPSLETVLHRYQLLEGPAQPGLDELTRLCATICEAPVALLALAEGDHLRFVSRVGHDADHGWRSSWPDAPAVLSDDLFVVPDAAADPRFAELPVVTGEPHLRFWAAAPLVTPTGEVIGVLAIGDRVPRTLSGTQTQTLRVLARQVVTELELRRQTRALQAREKLLAAIVESEPECVKLTDARGVLEMMNPAGLAMVEADSFEQVSHRSLYPLIAPEHRDAFRALTARVFGGETGELEFRIAGLKGTERWLETKATPLRDDSGQVVSLLGITRDVTERKQVEDELRSTEAQFSAVFHGSPIGIALVSFPGGRIVEVNEAMVTMSGYGRDDMIGRTSQELGLWVEPGERDEMIAEASRTGRTRRQTVLRRASGALADVRLELARVEVSGEPMLLAFVEDVTRELAAERALRETDEQIAEAFRRSPAPTLVLRRRDLAIVEVSGALLLFFELDRDRALGEPATSARLVAALDLERLATEIDRGAALTDVELVVPPDDGPARMILLAAEPIVLRGEAHVIVSFADISRRKRAEEERTRLVRDLEASLHRIQRLTRLYTILGEISQMIVRVREPSEVFAAACKIAVERGGFLLAWVGLASETTRSMGIVAHAGAAEAYLPELSIDLAQGPTQDGPTAQAWRTGVRVVCNDVASDPAMAPWRDRALAAGFRASAALPLTIRGETVGTLNLYAGEAGFFDDSELRLLDELAVDIAFALELHERELERQRAQDELRISEQRFRQLAETIEDVFFTRDLVTGRMSYVSPAFEKIWGVPRSAVFEDPTRWLEMVHPDDRERVRQEMPARTTPGAYQTEYRIVRPDGAVRRIQTRAYLVPESDLSPPRIIGVAKDVTESRELEDQLRQAQKMEAIGQLSGGIAHDFNNILAVILMHVELARRSSSLPPEVRTTLEEIGVSARRAADLTRKLLVFGRRQILQPKRVDLREQLTSLGTMLRRIVGEDIDLRVDVPPQPLVLKADPSMLDQVVMNLVVNARDAMPRGGSLVIEAREGSLDASATRTQRDVVPGRHVCLRVSDTGNGIPPDVRDHVFEPFFTTKGPGKGTGLGLATVFGIVKQHGGWIRLDSEVGHGTTFRIYLPLAEEDVGARPDERERPVARGGAEGILVVEDDPALRRIARRLLEEAGYQVLEAGDGIEALAVWAANPDAIDLVLTDILMPRGMNGRELAERLRRDAPDLPIVFTSGYAPDATGRDFDHGEAFLQKPYPTNELLTVVRASLDRKRARPTS